MGRQERKPKKQNSFRHPFRKKDVSLDAIKGFQLVKKIGKGSFGKVYKAKKDGKECAFKFVDLNDKEGDFALEGILTEWFSSEKIGPQFIGCWDIKKENLGVLASDLWDCSLDDFMEKNDRSRVPKLVMDKVTAQIKRLHSLDHVHLDLHGGNVLVKCNATGKNVVDATIADFGKSMHVHNINQKRLKLPIELFELRPTKDPKNIDLQLLKQLRSDYN